MPDKTVGLSELIQRLKTDGISAGESERNRIIEEARAQAQSIIAKASADAHDIMENANSYAKNRHLQLAAELKMAARDFIQLFRQRLGEKIIRPLILTEVNNIICAENFLASCLKELIVECAQSNLNLEVFVSAKTKEQLGLYFTSILGEQLPMLTNVVLTATADSGGPGFCLKKSGDNFTWDFSADAITDELRKLVDKSLREFIVPESSAQPLTGAVSPAEFSRS